MRSSGSVSRRMMCARGICTAVVAVCVLLQCVGGASAAKVVVEEEVMDVAALVAAGKKPKPDDYNQGINKKFEELNDSLNNLVDKAVSDDSGLFTEAQKGHMKKERERAGRARQRVHEAGGFKRWARKLKVDCFIAEVIGDGVGDDIQPCEKGEICEEVLDDQIGNDDGECEYRDCGKKNGEICVENCDEDTIDDINDNFDPNAAVDIEESLGDVTLVLDDANELLAARAERMAFYGALTEVAAAVDPADKCAKLPVPRVRAHTYTELQVTLAAANASAMAYNICDSAANQDALGFNGSSVCVVLAVAAGIVDTISDAFELQDDTVTSEQVDAACECLKQTSEQIGDIQKELVLLREMVKRRFDEVVALLNTPQGKRPAWPVKTDTPE